jgi:hypothetical protein
MFANWFTSSARMDPADCILEVGPVSTKYAVHSTLVTFHSGYLRAVIRSENLYTDGNGDKAIPVYIPNITNEQFYPLLSYMYTGYLDLNVDNIFGVLLATHLLHMPTGYLALDNNIFGVFPIRRTHF